MKAVKALGVALAAGIVALSGTAMAQTSGGGMQQPAAKPSTQAQTSQWSRTQGMTGNMTQSEIRRIQQALDNAGYKIAVDGKWGPQTENALRQFQQAKGLQATGQPTQETLAQLNVDMMGGGATGTGSTGGTSSMGQGSMGQGQSGASRSGSSSGSSMPGQSNQ